MSAYDDLTLLKKSYKLGKGSYANVYAYTGVNPPIAFKCSEIDDHFYYVHTKLRESLLMKNGFGMAFRGLVIDSNQCYVGFASDIAATSLNKVRFETIKEILTVAKDIAKCLSALHTSNILHGDLKPANILVTEEGRCVLCDLGLATKISSDKHFDVLYTPNYRPPEFFEKKPWYLNSNMDIWAFGITLFYMIKSSGHCSLSNTRDVFESMQENFPKDYFDCVRVMKHHMLGLDPIKNDEKDIDMLSNVIACCLRYEAHERFTAKQIHELLMNRNDYINISPSEKLVLSPKMAESIFLVTKLKASELETPRPFSQETCTSICRKILILVNIQFQDSILQSVLQLFRILGLNKTFTLNARSTYATMLVVMLLKPTNVFQISWCSRLSGVEYYEFEKQLNQALALAIIDDSWSKQIWFT